MTSTVSSALPTIAQRIALFAAPPAQRGRTEKVFVTLRDIRTSPGPLHGNHPPAARPGNILRKMQGRMSEEKYADFCNTLQRVKKGNPPPRIKPEPKITAPAVFSHTLPRPHAKSARPHSGGVPVPPPPPPPLRLFSQSMPELNKTAGWERVKGATLDEAMAGFKQHYVKKPGTEKAGAKAPHGADKKYDTMLSQLRDVLKNRLQR